MSFRKSLLLLNLNYSEVDLKFVVKPAQIPICGIHEQQVCLLKHSRHKNNNNQRYHLHCEPIINKPFQSKVFTLI